MMNQALALVDNSQYELMSKLAAVAAKSGYVGKTDVQALFVILKGFELGISPMQALDGIHVIQNKTTVSPQLMLALINRSGLLEDIKVETSAAEATVMMKRVGRSPHTEVFTIKDAAAMQLTGKDNWKKQPAVMLKWRAISACARIVFPDICQGVYMPEEMGADVSEDGSGEIVIEAPTAIIDADFTETNRKMEQLVEKNPVPETEQPVQSGEIPQNTATPSDLPQSEDKSDIEPEIAEKTPAERLGTPNGQRIGVWRFDRSKLLSALANRAKDFSYQERSNTVKKLDEEEAFKGCATIDDAVAIVMARLNSHRTAKDTPQEQVVF